MISSPSLSHGDLTRCEQKGACPSLAPLWSHSLKSQSDRDGGVTMMYAARPGQSVGSRLDRACTMSSMTQRTPPHPGPHVPQNPDLRSACAVARDIEIPGSDAELTFVQDVDACKMIVV